MNNSVASGWIALGVSTAVAYPAYRGLIAVRSRQTISEYAPEKHQAKQGTPTMGGIIVLAGLLMAILATSPTPIAALVLLVGFGLIGFLDDYVVPRRMPGKRGLGWRQKLVLQIVVAVAALLLDGRTPSAPMMGLGVFLILFLSNAYNFADGLDGLAGSLGILMAVGFAGIALAVGPESVPVAALALIGALVPFLFLNAPPARLFMGDVGALPIGALLGLLTFEIARVSGPNVWGALLVLNLMMVAELLPPPMQVFWVKAFKKRLFPYTPIHHAFERAGWPETRVVAAFGLAQLVLTAAALSWAWLARGNA